MNRSCPLVSTNVHDPADLVRPLHPPLGVDRRTPDPDNGTSEVSLTKDHKEANRNRAGEAENPLLRPRPAVERATNPAGSSSQRSSSKPSCFGRTRARTRGRPQTLPEPVAGVFQQPPVRHQHSEREAGWGFGYRISSGGVAFLLMACCPDPARTCTRGAARTFRRNSADFSLESFTPQVRR